MVTWTSPGGPDRDREARHFMRHVVPIYFDFRKDAESKQFVQTSFAFSVYGRWLLVTAGHCITDIEKIRAAGYKLNKCRLIDCLGLKAKYDEPVPFDYDEATPQMLCKDPMWDYGVIPLSEKWWDEEPQSLDAYFLFGVPELSVTASPNHVSLGPT